MQDVQRPPHPMALENPATTVPARIPLPEPVCEPTVSCLPGLARQQLGVGRFPRIELPRPELLAGFVGGVEIVCGALVLVGLLTRLAAIPLIIIMLLAIVSTKVPILLGKGFWAMAHEARTDWSMLLGSIFLLFAWAGPWSLDAGLGRKSLR